MNAQQITTGRILGSFLAVALTTFASAQQVKQPSRQQSSDPFATVVSMDGAAAGAWFEHVGASGDVFGTLYSSNGQASFALQAKLSAQSSASGLLHGELIPSASSILPAGKKLVVNGQYIVSDSFSGIFRAHVWLDLGSTYVPMIHVGMIDGTYGRMQEVLTLAAGMNQGAAQVGQDLARSGSASSTTRIVSCPKGRDAGGFSSGANQSVGSKGQASGIQKVPKPSGNGLGIGGSQAGGSMGSASGSQSAGNTPNDPNNGVGFGSSQNVGSIGQANGIQKKPKKPTGGIHGDPAHDVSATKPYIRHGGQSNDPLDKELAGKFSATWTLQFS